LSIAEQYARDVDSGKIVAGRQIKLAAKRFLADLQRDDIYFDEVEANKFVAFSERYCRLWEDKWRGEPVKLEPWMCFVFQQIFGWFKKKDGLRRVKKVYVQVAKKNAKSTVAGLLANYHLCADERINTPKIFTGANNEEQAKICVNIAGRIIEQSPDLYELVEEGTIDLFNYKDNIVNIVHREKDGFMKAMSKETSDKTSKTSGGKHGINPSLAIIDEYGLAESDTLLNTFITAQAARLEPLVFVITTAGFNKFGPCYTKLRQTGIEVNEGKVTQDSFLAFIYEMDEEDKIEDEANWKKCNPNLGVSVQEDFLRDILSDARIKGGSDLVDVTTLNFNKWCDAPKIFIADDVWMENRHGTAPAELEGAECFGGLYTASTKSLNVFLLFFPEFREKLNGFLCWAWLPEDAVLKHEDKVDYQRWIDEGFITVTPGNSADHRIMAADIMKILPKYDIKVVGFDKTFGQYVAPDLEAEGIEVMEIYQGFNHLGQQTHDLKIMATKKEIEHFGNPIIRWQLGNTITHRNGEGLEKPDKEASGSRIGAVSAMLNAMVAKFEYYKDGGMDNFTFSSMKK
jgi:phage terminase large subunit-like protein